MSPSTTLTTLILIATIAGAKLYTRHQLQNQHNQTNNSTEIQNYINALETQVSELQDENKTLRNLATSGANFTLPEELINFVEQDLGLTFKTPPLVRTTTEDSIREAAGQRYLAAFSESGIQMRSYTFEKLGIIPANQNFIGQLITAEANGSRGYYDITSSEILLIQDFDLENIHHQASAARLLAIALLDQHSPLPMKLTDDIFHAREATHRGRAAMLQNRFYNINSRQLGFVTEKANTEAIEVFKALAPYIQDLTTFPNIHGKTYIESLYQNDQTKTLTTLNNPPKTTAEILSNNSQEKHTNAPEIPTTQDTQLATRLGAITINSYLNQVLTNKETSKLTPLLVDDMLILTATGTKQVTATTTWITTWKTEQAAADFKSAAHQIAASLQNPPKITQTQNTTTLTYIENNIPTQ